MRSLITEAIRTCVLEWPRLATTLLRIQPRPKDGIGTVALDSHLRLYYDPEWLQGVDFNEVVFAIKQDLVHCLLKHPVRGQSILGHSKGAHRSYIQEKLNVAADFAVWDFLDGERQDISDSATDPREAVSVKNQQNLRRGLSLEEYFTHLYDKEYAMELEEQEQQSPDEGKSDVGQGTGGVEGGVPGEATQDGDLSVDGRKTGSSGDGEQREWEDDFQEQTFGDSGDQGSDSQGVGSDELDSLGDDFLEGSGRGHGSEGRNRGARPTRPKASPAQLLRMAVKNGAEKVSHGHDIPSYRKPSRRRQSEELIHPSYENPSPNVTIVVDTSGSMRESDLSLASGMVETALKGMRLGRVRVVAADSSIKWEDEVSSIKQVKLKGGGGTDMGGVCDKVANDTKNRCDLLICVTDGETDYPSSRKVPMVAAITRNSNYRSYFKVPSHIKEIDIYQQ